MASKTLSFFSMLILIALSILPNANTCHAVARPIPIDTELSTLPKPTLPPGLPTVPDVPIPQIPKIPDIPPIPLIPTTPIISPPPSTSIP